MPIKGGVNLVQYTILMVLKLSERPTLVNYVVLVHFAAPLRHCVQNDRFSSIYLNRLCQTRMESTRVVCWTPSSFLPSLWNSGSDSWMRTPILVTKAAAKFRKCLHNRAAYKLDPILTSKNEITSSARALTTSHFLLHLLFLIRSLLFLGTHFSNLFVWLKSNNSRGADFLFHHYAKLFISSCVSIKQLLQYVSCHDKHLSQVKIFF